MTKAKIALYGVVLVLVLFIIFYLVPIISHDLQVRHLRHSIQRLEAQVDDIQTERERCERVQASGHKEAEDLRILIEKNKDEYNKLQGFISLPAQEPKLGADTTLTE